MWKKNPLLIFHCKQGTMLLLCSKHSFISWQCDTCLYFNRGMTAGSRKTPNPLEQANRFQWMCVDACICVRTRDIICHLGNRCTLNTDTFKHFGCFYGCLWRLTLDSSSPGAVVQNSQLSKHLSWPHGAELQALLRHLHPPIWNMHKNGNKPLVTMIFKFDTYFLAWLPKSVSPILH